MSDFEQIKITDIKPAPYNPRTINDTNYEKLKNSLNQFGLVDPIVINLRNHNTIIGGHQRYKALLDKTTSDDLYLIRLGDIGWVFDNTDMKVEDENAEKLLNINLNQSNLMGEWDNEKLEDLFTDLQVDNVDLSLSGFEDWEIDEITINSFKDVNKYDNEHLNQPVVDIFDDERTVLTDNTETSTDIDKSNQNQKNDDTPNFEPVEDDGSRLDRKNQYTIKIHVKTIEEQETLYNELKERGYQCKMI